jgi:hypothetical protein
MVDDYFISFTINVIFIRYIFLNNKKQNFYETNFKIGTFSFALSGG